MTRWVVDSSVVLKWFLREPYDREACTLLGGSTAIDAPTLMPIEVTNILAKRAATEIISIKYAREARATLDSAGITLHETRRHLDAAFDLAVDLGQSVYDCVFLALALSLGCRLVTADERFLRKLRTTDLADRVVWVADIA